MFRKYDPVHLLVVAVLFLVSLGLAATAFGHSGIFSDEENEWLNRQRAIDGTKCCDRFDTHVGMNVRFRMNGGSYEVFIMEAWYKVPPERIHRYLPDDPSPWPGEALLFFTWYPHTGPSIWCFRPSTLG